MFPKGVREPRHIWKRQQRAENIRTAWNQSILCFTVTWDLDWKLQDWQRWEPWKQKVCLSTSSWRETVGVMSIAARLFPSLAFSLWSKGLCPLEKHVLHNRHKNGCCCDVSVSLRVSVTHRVRACVCKAEASTVFSRNLYKPLSGNKVCCVCQVEWLSSSLSVFTAGHRQNWLQSQFCDWEQIVDLSVP